MAQETENTDSDSQGQIDLELLPDAANNWLGEHGFTTGEQPALPSIISDFPYATMDEAYEVYYNQNSLPAPVEPEGGFTSQEQVDAYNAQIQQINAHNAQVNENFNLDVQQPYFDAVESYNSDISGYSEGASSTVNALFRIATPASLKKAFSVRDVNTNAYAIDKLELLPEEDYQFNLPGLGQTNIGNFQGGDFFEYDKYFELVETDQKVRSITPGGGLMDSKGREVVLTQEGQQWLATVIDPQALQNLEARIESDLKPRAQALQSELDALYQKAERQGIGREDVKKVYASQFNRITSELSQVERFLEDGGWTEEDLQTSRREVWKKMNSDKVREEYILSFEDFKALYPNEEYRDYLQYMETKVYKDLMSDMGGSMAAMFFGDKGTKIALDNDSTVGERNSRFEEALTSWQMGLIDTQGQFDAMASKNPLKYEGEVAFGASGTHMVPTWKTKAEMDESMRAYRQRELERNQKLRELESQLNVYYVDARAQDLFGENALMTESALLDRLVELKTSSLMISDEEFEFAKEAIRSMPTSLSAQAVGAIGTIGLGGNVAFGAGLTTLMMSQMVSAKTYMDTYMNPEFDDWDDVDRQMYSQAMGFFEGVGEGADYLLLWGGGKLLKGANFGPFSRGYLNRYTMGAGGDIATRTWGGFLTDMVAGGSAYMGVNMLGEGVAEGVTGGLQHLLEEKANGREINYEDFIDRIHHDAKVGVYSGLLMSGGSLTFQNASLAIQDALEGSAVELGSFEQKALESLRASAMQSGAMHGVANRRDANKLRELRKQLNESLGARELSTDVISRVLNGQRPSEAELNESELEILRQIKGLMSKNISVQKTEDEAIKQLMRIGRYDLVADLVAANNLEKYHSFAMNTGESGITEGYGSRMGPNNVDKSAIKEERDANRLRIRGIQEATRLGLAREVGMYKPKQNRAELVTVTESSEGVYVLQGTEAEVSEDIKKALGDQAALVEEASRYSELGGDGVRVVVHTSADTFQKAAGVYGSTAVYLEASEEQRGEGMQDEVHIVLTPETNETRFRTELIHEMGHFRFRDLVNNSELRAEFADAILELARKDEKVNQLVLAVREAYPDYSREDFERELINNYVQAVAQRRVVIRDAVVDFSTTLFSKTVSNDGLLIAMQNFADDIASVTGHYGNFTKQDFVNQLEHDRNEQEAQEKEFSAKEEGKVEDTQEAMEARKLGGRKPFTYLQNTTLYYSMIVSDFSIRGNEYQKIIEKTVTVKDYNHFRNLYAKLTGNGAEARRMTNIRYQKEGKVYNVKPPKPKVDMRTGEPIAMAVPEYKGWQTREVERRQARMDARDAIRNELVKARNELQEMHRNSVLKDFSNYQAFFPYESYSRDDFQFLSDGEQLNILEAAIENAKAFMMSDITVEDVNKRTKVQFTPNGYNAAWLTTKDNLDIFNAAKNKIPTRGEKISRLNEGIERHGLRAWEMLPVDSPARARYQKDFSLISSAELQYALNKLDGLDSGISPNIGPIDLDPGSDIKSVEARSLAGTQLPGQTASKFLSKNLEEALSKIGVELGDVNFSIHNVDRTRVGSVEIKYKANGKEFVLETQLSGGPMGAAYVKDKGGQVLHTNTNDESAAEIANYMKVDPTRHHAVLLALLKEENSLGNPVVFNIGLKLVADFIKNSESAEIVSRAEAMFNAFLQNQFAKPELSKYEHSDNLSGWGREVAEVKVRFGEVLVGKLGLDGTQAGLELNREQGVKVVGEEGVMSMLTLLSQNANKLGFGVRGSMLNKIFQKSGMAGAKGFPSEQDFLKEVNDPSLRGAKTGDIFSGALVRAEEKQNIGWSSNVKSIIFADAPSSAQRSSYLDAMAYTTGTVNQFARGRDIIKPFIMKNPLPKDKVMKVEARQRTSGIIEGYEGMPLESRRLMGRMYVQGQTKWEQSTPTPYGAVLQKLALKLQDKYSDVLLLQQDVEEFKGGRVAESQDFEMAMDLFYGKVRTDLERIEEMLDGVNKMAKEFGITPEQISDYLYAKHAPERNAFIFGRNPQIQNGSGLTNQEAEEILDELDSANMRAVASKVYDIIEFTRKYMVEGGLEKRAVIAEWTNRFKYYVPLNGLAEDQMDAETQAYPSGGSGMAIYGPSTRKAKGRTSKTGSNIVGNIVMQAAAVVQRARKDEAMLSLYRLAKENPNTSVWTVHGPKNRFVSMGTKLSDQAMKAREDVVPLRINGEQHFIKFKNADYARSLNGLTVEQLDYTSRQAAKYVSFLRNSYTVWNPAFFIPNFARDFSSALFNAAAEIDRDGGVLNNLGISVKDFNMKMMGTTMNVLGQLLKEAHGSEVTGEVAQYMDEWKASGGRTGWSYSDTLNKIVSDMNDKTTGKSKAGEMLGKIWGNSVGAVGNYVEGVNDAFEQAVRLGAYIEARRAGASKQRSAQLSKNITVNFNKSGEVTPSINAWFLFFNAAVQGTSRFGRSFATAKAQVPQGQSSGGMQAAQKMGAYLTMLSFAQTVINIMISGRDDDDELFYKKDIPDYRKQRNLIIMTGERDNVQVPLPYGINLFSNLGTILAELCFGVRDLADAGMFLALSGHSSFSPIAFGQGDNLVQGAASTLMPTFLKPATEVAFNSTYFGGKVYQEQFPFGTPVPEYSLAFRTPEFIVEMNQALNEMSGGKEFIGGDFDFNPDPYYYLMLSLLGGAGKFTGDVVDLSVTGSQVVKNAINETSDSKGFLEALMDTEKPVIRRGSVPFAKIVLGEASRFYDFDLFDENREEVMQYVNQAKKYVEGEAEDIEGLDFRGIQELEKILEDTENVLSDLRSLRREIRQSDEMDYIKKQNLLYTIEQEETKLLVYFNAEYYRLRGQFVDPRPTGIIPEQTLRQSLGIE